jgi:hypothetical protein
LVLSEAAAKFEAARPAPAEEERISASRRVSPARFVESAMRPPSLNRWMSGPSLGFVRGMIAAGIDMDRYRSSQRKVCGGQPLGAVS